MTVSAAVLIVVVFMIALRARRKGMGNRFKFLFHSYNLMDEKLSRMDAIMLLSKLFMTLVL